MSDEFNHGHRESAVIADPGSQAPNEQDYGLLYQSADAGSLTGQRRFLRATQVRLFGFIVAAIGGVFVVSVGPVDVFGLIALVAFVTVLAAEAYIVSQRPDRTWYEGRAAAESVKTLAWRFMVGGEPFPVTMPAKDADALYLGRLNEVLQDLNGIDLSPALSGHDQITREMRRVRELDLDARRATYESDRVEDQRAWYARKSVWNGQRSLRWSIAAIALELSGVVGASLKAFQVTDVDLLGLLAAAAAGITAWIQAKQFTTLQRAYFVASQELASIRSQMATPMSEQEWGQVVQDAEEAISREHTLWRASRGMRVRTQR